MVCKCVGGGDTLGETCRCASTLGVDARSVGMRDGHRQKMLVIIRTYSVKSCLPGCRADTSRADVAVDADGDGRGW